MPEDLISSDANYGSIYIHSGITSTVTTSFSSPASAPQGLTFSGGVPTRRYGNLVSAAAGKVYIHVGVTSTITTSFNIPSSGEIGITVDTSGNLISARAGDETVRIHAGITSTVTTSFSTPGGDVRGITLDASGNLISVDIGTHSVYIHSGITSTITTSFTIAAFYINGLEITEAGNLLAADYNLDRIYIHSGITSTVTTSFNSPKSKPWGLTLRNPPTDASTDLLGKAEVGQNSAVLSAQFDVGQNSSELLGNAEIQQSGSAELLGKFEAQATAELLGRAEVGQNSAGLLGKGTIQHSDSAELLGNAVIRHSNTAEFLGKGIIRQSDTIELLGKFEAQATAELLGKFEAQATADLLGKFEAQATADLLGKAKIQHSDSAELLGRFEAQATAEVLSKFRVSCPRRMGDNWQRKMWFDGTYYWRGRCNPPTTEIVFEYIEAAGLAGNVWTKNENASIDCSGMAADRIMADFTVRGGESGIPTTIHYSDGVSTHVAESDETSLTGWAWQNLTTVFTGGGGDTYRKVNLGANRTTPTPRLWAVAVFYDDLPAGKQWVKASRQTTGGILGGWDGEVPISDVDNTATIYGCSVRSMGDSGVGRNDVMVVYKKGVELKSRYYDGDWDDDIEDIDTTTLPGKSAWDFEHAETLGIDMGHVVYVDDDGSVKWTERDDGVAAVWNAPQTLHAAADHRGVGIVEHGAGWLWIVWVEGEDVLEYRLHQCVPEVWFPLLGSSALQFNVNTDAVVTTSTVRQPQTPDWIPSGEAVPICWIGETAPATPCAPAWGILIEYSIASLKGILDVRHSTSVDLYAQFEVGQGSAELLGNAVVRQTGTPVELLGNAIIRQTGSAELVASCVIRHSSSKNLDAKVNIVHWEDLYGKTKIRHTATPLNLPAIFWVRWPSRLWTSRRYINGVIELDEKLLGDASLEYVIEGVMEDTQGYLDNAGLSYSEWTDITLVPVQILRAVTYGTVAALYARHTQTFRSQVVPSVTPVTVTVIGDAEKAMNYWEDRMNQMLEFYVTSQGGDVMLTSTPDEEPIFSMEDIPEEVTEYVSWRIWLQERDN